MTEAFIVTIRTYGPDLSTWAPSQLALLMLTIAFVTIVWGVDAVDWCLRASWRQVRRVQRRLAWRSVNRQTKVRLYDVAKRAEQHRRERAASMARMAQPHLGAVRHRHQRVPSSVGPRDAA